MILKINKNLPCLIIFIHNQNASRIVLGHDLYAKLHSKQLPLFIQFKIYYITPDAYISIEHVLLHSNIYI